MYIKKKQEKIHEEKDAYYAIGLQFIILLKYFLW